MSERYWIDRGDYGVKSRLGSMNKAERDRAHAMKFELGCVACRQLELSRWADLHHILNGGYRVSHSHSIPLCPWHHRGIPLDDMTASMTKEVLGANYADEKRKFVEQFGSEIELLERADKWYSKFRGE